jgi:uncharacterized membrane protein
LETISLILKEGLEASIITLAFLFFFKSQEREELVKPLLVGIFTSLLLALALSFSFGKTAAESKTVLEKSALFLIGGLYLASFAVYFQSKKINFLGPVKDLILTYKALQHSLIALVIFLILLPDGLGLILHLKALAYMKEDLLQITALTILGFVSVILIASFLFKIGLHFSIGRMFTPANLVVFITAIKLIGGGVGGYTQPLIVLVEARILKLFHDFFHLLVVFLLLPDHPIVKTSIWTFIYNLLFGSKTGLAETLIVFSLPVLLLLISLARRPLPKPAIIERGPERRKLLKAALTDKRLKATPVILAILIILLSAYAAPASSLYDPEPQPIVAEKNRVILSISEVSDGKLHKFAYSTGDKVIRLLAIKKPNTEIAVVLDICNICQPEGYAQLPNNDLLCKYCQTPIPIESVGDPGGCNPVPLKFKKRNNKIEVELSELIQKFNQTMAGK